MRSIHSALIALTLTLSSGLAFAQTPAPAPVTPSPTAATPAATPPQAAPTPVVPVVPPAPVVMTPADPSSTLTLQLANERAINYQHQAKEVMEDLNKQFQVEATKRVQPLQQQAEVQAQIMSVEIGKIKAANHWGDDISYDPQQEKFIKGAIKPQAATPLGPHASAARNPSSAPARK